MTPSPSLVLFSSLLSISLLPAPLVRCRAVPARSHHSSGLSNVIDPRRPIVHDTVKGSGITAGGVVAAGVAKAEARPGRLAVEGAVAKSDEADSAELSTAVPKSNPRVEIEPETARREDAASRIDSSKGVASWHETSSLTLDDSNKGTNGLLQSDASSGFIITATEYEFTVAEAHSGVAADTVTSASAVLLAAPTEEKKTNLEDFISLRIQYTNYSNSNVEEVDRNSRNRSETADGKRITRHSNNENGEKLLHIVSGGIDAAEYVESIENTRTLVHSTYDEINPSGRKDEDYEDYNTSDRKNFNRNAKRRANKRTGNGKKNNSIARSLKMLTEIYVYGSLSLSSSDYGDLDDTRERHTAELHRKIRTSFASNSETISARRRERRHQDPEGAHCRHVCGWCLSHVTLEISGACPGECRRSTGDAYKICRQKLDKHMHGAGR